MSEDTIKRTDAIEVVKAWFKIIDLNPDILVDWIVSLPSADRPRGKWIDEAISIIDDMQREGIVDYQQAWEYRMRARMKGADDGTR